MAVALDESIEVGWLEDNFLSSLCSSGTEEDSAHSLAASFPVDFLSDSDVNTSKLFAMGGTNLYTSLSRFGDDSFLGDAGMQRLQFQQTSPSVPAHFGEKQLPIEGALEVPLNRSGGGPMHQVAHVQMYQSMEPHPAMLMDSIVHADENEWTHFLSTPTAPLLSSPNSMPHISKASDGSLDTTSDYSDPQKFRRTRTQWETDEESALLEGVAEYGVGYWKQILQDKRFSKRLWRRRNVDLKDKWRVLNRRGAKKLQAALNKAKQDLKMRSQKRSSPDLKNMKRPKGVNSK